MRKDEKWPYPLTPPLFTFALAIKEYLGFQTFILIIDKKVHHETTTRFSFGKYTLIATFVGVDMND